MKNTQLSFQNLTIWLLMALMCLSCPNDPHCLTCKKISNRFQCISCQQSQLNIQTGECLQIPSKYLASHRSGTSALTRFEHISHN